MQLPHRLLGSVLDGIRGKKEKGKIKDKDWIEILEATKGCLRPHLNTFANTPLGHVRLWGSGRTETLETDLQGISRVWEGAINLSTPGFWTEPHSSGKKMSGTEVMTFWGITRKGDWALVKLRAQVYVEGKTADGKEFRRHKAIELNSAKVSDVREICKESERDLFGIFDSLYLATYSWSKRREELARDAMAFHDSMEALHQIITSCQER